MPSILPTSSFELILTDGTELIGSNSGKYEETKFTNFSRAKYFLRFNLGF